MENSEINDLLKKITPSLFKIKNLTATGIGYKVTGGKRLENLSIICSVDKKLPLSALSKKEILPSNIDSIPVDVISTGTIIALNNRMKMFRPSPGGVSLGHSDISSGTFGSVVQKNGKKYILSNNHVLANSNMGKRGDQVYQPAAFDGGKEKIHVIGQLAEYIPIVFEKSTLLEKLLQKSKNAWITSSGKNIDNAEFNLVDAAIAFPNDQSLVVNEILHIGEISGVSEPYLNMRIKKCGRTTGITAGIIEQIHVTVRVSFSKNRTAMFTDQLIAGAMSRSGDSGSVILTNENRAIGLLFAGSDTTTVINRIDNVIEALKISFSKSL